MRFSPLSSPAARTAAQHLAADEMLHRRSRDEDLTEAADNEGPGAGEQPFAPAAQAMDDQQRSIELADELLEICKKSQRENRILAAQRDAYQGALEAFQRWLTKTTPALASAGIDLSQLVTELRPSLAALQAATSIPSDV